MNSNTPAPVTSVVKWSKWSRWTDENGVTWLRYSLRCTDPLPKELFDKLDSSSKAPPSSTFVQIDNFAEPEEGTHIVAYKTHGFIIREDVLFGDHPLPEESVGTI
jgi:hypothetical protein